MSRLSTPSLSPHIRLFQFITGIIFHTTNTIMAMAKLIVFVYILINTNILILWWTVHNVHTTHDHENRKANEGNNIDNEIEQVIEPRILYKHKCYKLKTLELVKRMNLILG